jgi:hypothetical protein
MNKLTKIFLVVITSISLSFSAIAGELTVTGSAKASYVVGGDSTTYGKGIGISNEFTLGASGELDNGYTWKYAVDMDPNAGGTVDNDDQQLTLTTPYGTVGMFVSEGGLSTELGYGIGANGVGFDYASPMTFVHGYDVSSYSSIQYHMPADMLPFGIIAKYANVPNMRNTGDSKDFKSQGGTSALTTLGESAEMLQIKATPIDGLSVGGDYFQTSNADVAKEPTSGNLFAKYTMGAFTVGVNAGQNDVGTNGGAVVTKYENRSFGVQYALNDAINLSYSRDKSDQFTSALIVAGATSNVKTSIESVVDSIQVSYNVGGATLGIAHQDADDSDYTANKDEQMTVFSVVMAF